MIGVFLFRAFFGGDVTVTQNVPSKVNPGDEFTVEVTISKGALNGFAQLKCELPEGFIPSQGELGGSEFKYSGGIIRFTWTALPGDATIKITYKVKVDASVSGVKSLTGKFSYVLNGQKSAVEMAPAEITVGTPKQETVENTPPVNPTTTTTNNPPPDTTNKVVNNNPPPDNSNNKTSAPANVSAMRNMPKNAKPGDEFTVEVTINKGALKGFARFQDVLPDGLTASAGETKGGTFSFLDQKAKIVWDNIPPDEQLVISYKVKVSNTALGDQTIEGLFSYVENDEPKKIILTPSLIAIDKGENQVVNNNPPPDTNKVVKNTPPPPDTNTKVVNNNPPVDNTNNTNTNNNTNNNKQEVPPPSTGVSYKVQICAVHNMVPVSYFQNKYSISGTVNMESHEGWTKYTTGSFKMYKDARDHRETMRGKGIDGPFVTAYNQGTRITVQEALMISGQQ
jgi:hypothetical protein